jgi:anti-anti-sigma regulatory factor
MLNVNVENFGKVAVVYCEGRIVRSDAAFRLRDAVTQQRDARVVLLDLSGVGALEGGGLGMLLFLDVWTRNRGIQLKVFDPTASVRKSIERVRSAVKVEIAGMAELLSLLRWERGQLWDRSLRTA